MYIRFNPLSANVGYFRHALWRRAKPSCNAQFELEIVIFGLTRRNWIVLHGQAKDNLKVSLSSEILSKNLTKIHFFEILTVFLTIFGQPPNLALFYFILSSSELIWSFTTGHLSVNSVRSAQRNFKKLRKKRTPALKGLKAKAFFCSVSIFTSGIF